MNAQDQMIMMALGVIIALIGVMTPVIKLNTSITRLNSTLENLQKNTEDNHKELAERVGIHGKEIDSIKEQIAKGITRMDYIEKRCNNCPSQRR